MLLWKEQSEQLALDDKVHMDVWSSLIFLLVKIVCEPTVI
jgi:hypothetical protein